MDNNDVKEKIASDEFVGEKLISKFRLAIAVIYTISVIVCSFMNNNAGNGYFPPRAYISNSINTIYSFIIFLFLLKATSVHWFFKYFCVIFDMVIISMSVWIGCTYVEICPPITYLSIWALFYFVLILIGSFRYSIPCAIFSGIFAGFCYFSVVYINKDTIDLAYSLQYNDKSVYVGFPIINEFFRVIAMMVTGIITAMACKRHLKLFNVMLESKSAAAQNAADTVIKIYSISNTLKKSTNEIFHSSKEIFTTANNQAASIQEIEATINENVQIAHDISDKTSNVASIATKMEDDVTNGFQVLKQNISQLDEIKSENNEVISGIIELRAKLSKIRDFILSIEDITDQTKVIAFNASLEAASAGEYGKRFSVVASEVNRLSDDIASLTKKIRNQADEIQNTSSSLVDSGQRSSEKISTGNNLINELENIFMKIKSGAEVTSAQAQTISVSTLKQQKSSDQINIAIQDISKGLTNFIQSTKIATNSAEELTKIIEKLDLLLEENA